MQLRLPQRLRERRLDSGGPDLHADADYSIWEGFACQGYPVMTILRGKVIVEHGKLVGSSSDGRWVEGRVSGDVLGRPAV